ncbi:hypothetical protein M3Y94_00462400 [Aphelenchoides besseyi]|nr:hypothetical protein M3Y94_00462400 [Aphelenchoides besseyi]KAI6229203.1 hypothetical protein M3Y95_00506600 [Aphelenchoides besseyi]
MKRHLAWREPDQVCPLLASSPPATPSATLFAAAQPAFYQPTSQLLASSSALQSLCAAVFDSPQTLPTTNPFANTIDGASGAISTAGAVQLNDYIRNIAALNTATTAPTPITQQPPVSDLSKLVAALQQQQQAPLTSLCDLGATNQQSTANYAYAAQPPTCTDVAGTLAAAASLLNNRAEDGNGTQVTAADAAMAVVNAISHQQALVSAVVGQPAQTSTIGPKVQSQQNSTDMTAFLSNPTVDPSSHRRQSISAAVGQFLASAASSSSTTSADETSTLGATNASALSGIVVNPILTTANSTGTTSSSAANLSIVKQELDSVNTSLVNSFVTPAGSKSIESFLNSSFLQPQSNQPAASQSTGGAFKFVGSPQQSQFGLDSQAQLLQKAAAVVAAVQQQQPATSLPTLHLPQSLPQTIQQDPNPLVPSLYSPNLHEALKMLRSPQIAPNSNVTASLVNALAVDLQPPPNKKPIPLNGPIDLASFRWRDPLTWTTEDVVAWVLDVARRHNIAREDIGVIEFGSYTGTSLARMTEQDFQEINSNFGHLLYSELRKMSHDESISTIDDLIRYCKDRDSDEETGPSTSCGLSATNTPKPTTIINVPQQTSSVATNFGRFFAAAASPLSPLMQGTNTCNPSASLAALHSPLQAQHQLQQHSEPNLQQLFASHSHLTPHGVHNSTAAVFAQQQKQLSDLQQHVAAQATHQQMFHASQLLPNKHSTTHLGMSPMPGTSGCNDYDSSSDFGGGKIRKNKDGRPRKRSQHTKGNKLWEFIRDALKDSNTCPSVVRWEDPEQGVFRIVESEKLARLWGEKKNNQKMTYEKLSRAMRTYYEKQILVPVPKTGLYPKKLVYKFGPGAHGWSAPPQLAHACLKLQQNE